eukprot:CAMPEP_0172515748 /NCGR_PEP_ID=MMETSP1066-20121228/270288_1 /TAXON_ID=671091 /ORGANISM="Coscinodiscus wailesii, Strain CCMP2513" /LENGTH=270 /DNA_ID=CAMNT_0013296909 /DNA_START=188 /DNA_END=1000 /DNA_ORIENTATION=-
MKPNYDKVLKKGTRYDGWFQFKNSPVVKFGPKDSPTIVFGTSANDQQTEPRVLSPPLMECLQGFFPYAVSEENFWLRYSLARDGASLETLLSRVRGCAWTILAIETTKGEVFGSLTGTAWHITPNHFGSGEAFLWKLKSPRVLDRDQTLKEAMYIDTDLEIYPFTGYDRYVQHCTRDSLIVGGGTWKENSNDNPYTNEIEGVGLELHPDLERGATGSCSTFANRVLCNTVDGRFDILNVEAWTLTPCMNIADATDLESRKSFIDEHHQER